MPRPFYLPLVEPGVLLSLKATTKKIGALNKAPILLISVFYAFCFFGEDPFFCALLAWFLSRMCCCHRAHRGLHRNTLV